MSQFVVSQIDSLGRRVVEIIRYTLNVLLMIYLSCRAALLDQAQGIRTVVSVVSAQIYFTGFQAMPII